MVHDLTFSCWSGNGCWSSWLRHCWSQRCMLILPASYALVKVSAMLESVTGASRGISLWRQVPWDSALTGDCLTGSESRWLTSLPFWWSRGCIVFCWSGTNLRSFVMATCFWRRNHTGPTNIFHYITAYIHNVHAIQALIVNRAVWKGRSCKHVEVIV